jgi:hypothetical protein
MTGDDERGRCEAMPQAARSGHDGDGACAANAVTTVRFRGVDVPICRLHAATYARWGDGAEDEAMRAWAWSRATLRSG